VVIGEKLITTTQECNMLTVEEARRKFQGIIVPLATVFTKNGDLDIESTAENVQWLIDKGAREGNTVFLAAGSGGDFTSLNTDERKQVIKAVVDVTKGRVPIMAGAQSTDIRTCIELAQYCEDLGVDAAQISGAYYYDGKENDFVGWMEEVARHTNIGFSLYNHYYSGSKYDVPLDVMDRLIDIPNSIVIKWGSLTEDKFYDGVKLFLPKIAVIDNTLFAVFGHILGCRGWISHVPNFFPEGPWKVWDLMENGNYKQAQQNFDEFMPIWFNVVNQIGQATSGEGVFVRAGMNAVGLKGGYSRRPSRDNAVPNSVNDDIKRLIDQTNSKL